MKTVPELFRRLEAEGITYALPRNYETLPDLRVSENGSNTDIDLVIASDELPRVRKVLAKLAEDLDWDALSECDHFTRSESRHHNIEIFRFYRVSPLEFLQIDVFHGYVSWGLPVMDEATLIEDRRYDAGRQLTRVNPLKENTYRLVQLHGLRESKRAADKIGRYRGKVLNTFTTQPDNFSASVRRHLGSFGLTAVRKLEENDMAGFSKAMNRVKTWFAIRFALRHPGQTLRFVYQRILDNRSRYKTRQCGTSLKVHAETPEPRERFMALMNSLTKLNAFDGWLVRSDPVDAFTRRERHVMEQGGLVIQWTGPEHADIVLVRGESTESIATKIIARALDRHALLHSRPMLSGVER